MSRITFDRDFDPRYGEVIEVMPGVSRLTANNPNAFTAFGTNSYLLGDREVAILDPGPEDEAHLDALLKAIGGRRVTHIILTHAHSDHVGGMAAIKQATGARSYSSVRREAPIVDYRPDIVIGDGDTLSGDGWSLTAIATPGHASDHLAFALEGTGTLFSGDHVMGWSTSTVRPPDGSMAEYIASLDRMIARPEPTFLPGHGGPIADGPKHARGLKAHRLQREAAILKRIEEGDRAIDDVVAALYRGINPALKTAAAYAVLAHLERLVAEGRVKSEGGVTLQATFTPA